MESSIGREPVGVTLIGITVMAGVLPLRAFLTILGVASAFAVLSQIHTLVIFGRMTASHWPVTAQYRHGRAAAPLLPAVGAVGLRYPALLPSRRGCPITRWAGRIPPGSAERVVSPYRKAIRVAGSGQQDRAARWSSWTGLPLAGGQC
jgi:hypothetical protein